MVFQVWLWWSTCADFAALLLFLLTIGSVARRPAN